MAEIKTITTDPVVLASQSADEAPDNSKAYDKAWATLVSAIATTPAGVKVKIAALQSMLCDAITEETMPDWVTLLDTLHKSIDAMSIDADWRQAA